MHRLSRRISLIWLSPLVALVAAGCGGLLSTRGLNLTGGSVPVGTSKAAVIVDPGDALNGQAPAPDVTLIPGTLTRAVPGDPTPPVDPNPEPDPAPPGGGAGPAPIMPTNPGGTPSGGYREYLFENLPTGFYTLAVDHPDTAGFGLYRMTFQLPGDSMARMVAAPWPTSFDPETVGEVQISPRQVTVSPGETVRFFGTATDVTGERIPQPVSYLLIGDTGDLAPKGSYTARRLGKSTISAWMNGKWATADITVVP